MRRRNIDWLVLAMTTATLAGCVGESSKRSASMSEADKQRLSAYVLDAVPEGIPNKLDINFENRLHLLGYKAEPVGVARPGSEVKLTMYWRCDHKLDDGWSLFTHVLDQEGRRILNVDNVGPLREQQAGGRQAFSPSAWEKGKVYVDEQVFRIPQDVTTPEIQIVTGAWKGNARLKVVNGPVDKENRGIVMRLKTGVVVPAGSHTSIPSLRVNKLAKGQTIKIDGKLDEDAWKEATSSGPFVEVGTGKPNTSFPADGVAKLAWDDQNLYVAFEVKDRNVRGGFPKDAVDPHLWTKDTIEIMLDPDGDGDNLDYYEIQINPQNLVFDTQYDSYNQPKTEPNGPYGHQDWSSNLKSAVVVHGTLDKSDDEDEGYTVEAAIPWASFTKAKQSPPNPGDSWRMNFYAMKNNSGVAWSPILGKGNFHKASRFGRVTFAERAPERERADARPRGGADKRPQVVRQLDPDQIKAVREELEKRRKSPR